MAKNERIVIGIDPDIRESGFAVVCNDTILRAEALSFPLLIENIQSMKACNPKVIVEAGWLNQSVWHGAYRQNVRVASKIGINVGQNQEVGKLIVEMCNYYGFEVKLQKPFRKPWRSADGKITRDELKMVCGFDQKTTQDVRDAILIAWYNR